MQLAASTALENEGQWKQVGRLGILEKQMIDKFIFGYIYV